MKPRHTLLLLAALFAAAPTLAREPGDKPNILFIMVDDLGDEPMMLYFPMALTHGPLVATPAERDVTEKMAKHTAMVRYTDAALGRLMDALTDFSDLLPTFCDLAGAPLPENETLDGKSIAGVILGKDTDGPRDRIMALGHGPAALDEQGVRPKQEFTDRVVRDKRYKLFVLNGQSARLVDLQEDPAEEINLLESTDPEVVAARKKLEAAIATCPKTDARPQYTPTPPQPWDAKPKGEKTGKKRNKPKQEA